MDTNKMLDELSKYGLTEVQAKVYYHLLRLGRTSYVDITKEIGVHRSEVYSVLRELKEKGIISTSRGRPVLFTSMPPKDALNVLLNVHLERIAYLKKIMPKQIDWLNSQANVKRAKPSVLLVDDDKSVVKTISQLLKRNGYDVDMVGDGSEALKKARLKAYKIALVDVHLPDVKGTKLLRKLKEENSDIKKIIITGYPSIENAMEAVNEGADAYILKPFEPKDLLAKIKKVLE